MFSKVFWTLNFKSIFFLFENKRIASVNTFFFEEYVLFYTTGIYNYLKYFICRELMT